MSVNILKARIRPSRMWIDGKCFNIRPTNENSPHRKPKIPETAAEETADHGFNITVDENGKLCTSFRLPVLYYKEIMSYNVKLLESDTSTKICIPVNGAEGNLKITGEDATNIIEARHHVHTFVDKIRNSSRPLQFISIPTRSDEIQANFERFKHEILNESAPIQGMDESIFQSGLKLHLTISVFSLFDDTEVEEAKKTLQDCREKVLKDLIANAGPLKIEVAGLDCMEKNRAKVNVLYANARILDEKNGVNLQKIVDSIADYFYERGFVRRPEETVKLHCTLINTKYRKSLKSPKRRNRWQKRESFDGRGILEKYKDYYFGVCNFDSVHLSLISSVGDDGFYKALSVLKFVD